MPIAAAPQLMPYALPGAGSPRFEAALAAALAPGSTATPAAISPVSGRTAYDGATTAPTPADASADAYRAAAVSGGGPALAPAPVGDWNAAWEQRFEQLSLAPADIAYLRSAGYGAAELDAIARQLATVEPIDSPGPVDQAPPVTQVGPPEPTGPNADVGGWSDAWAEKFGAVLTQMGVPRDEVDRQLQDLATRDLTNEDLASAYVDMRAAVGDFDPSWKQKFSDLMTKLEVPEEQRTQALQQLAQSGLTTAKLQETYDGMASSLPGWNDDWQHKFEGLGLPKELVEQVKSAKGSDAQLRQQYDALAKTRDEYRSDGRLKRLEDADATDAEKWGVMTQGVSGKDFDKVVDQIHSSHVPAWKRILSIGINLIPGAYAVQYLAGKDLLTGDKIDRTNPLNILGAVGSGFAAFGAIRGAMAIGQGLHAANAGIQAGKLAQGTMQAIDGAGLLSKFNNGLKAMDYVKAMTPVVNRFGEAGRLAQVGRGYSQAMQLAAGSAALRTAADGSVVVDKAIKSNVLSSLKQGNSITDALSGVHRSAGGAQPLLKSADIVKSFNQNGFLQSGGVWKFNPFKRDATVSVGKVDANTGTRLIELGRGVNFGTRGGLAQGIGSIKAANIAGAPKALQAGAVAAAGVSSHAASTFGLQDAMVAKWANELGVTGGSPFRTLAQLGGSNRAAGQTARAVANEGNRSYAIASRIAKVPSNSNLIVPGIGIGLMGGSLGAQFQPGWTQIKDDPGSLIGQSKYEAANEQARRDAEAEQQRLAADYARRQAGTGTGTAGVPAG